MGYKSNGAPSYWTSSKKSKKPRRAQGGPSAPSYWGPSKYKRVRRPYTSATNRSPRAMDGSLNQKGKYEGSDKYWNYVMAKDDGGGNGDSGWRPTGGGRSGGGYGRGYGGGGGSNEKEINKKLVEGLQGLLGSSAFTAKDIDGLLGQVAEGVSADQDIAAGAYTQLGEQMGAIGNPYEDMQVARTPQLAAEMAALLQQNGGDTAAYKAEVGLANNLAAQGDAAAERFKQQMAAATKRSNAGRVAEAAQSGEYVKQELSAAGRAMKVKLEAKQREEQKALDQQKMAVVLQLITAMAQSGTKVDIGQFFPGGTT